MVMYVTMLEFGKNHDHDAQYICFQSLKFIQIISLNEGITIFILTIP